MLSDASSYEDEESIEEIPATTITVPSLHDLCLNVIKSKPRAFESVGAAPFHLVQEALRNFSAADLQVVEENSHFIKDDPRSDGIWKVHFLREFPAAAEQLKGNMIPQPESWRKLYFEKQRELADKEERIRKKLRSTNAEMQRKEEGLRTIMLNAPLKLQRKKPKQSAFKSAFKKAIGSSAYKEMLKDASYLTAPSRIGSTSVERNIRQPQSKIYTTPGRNLPKATTRNMTTVLVSNARQLRTPYDRPTFFSANDHNNPPRHSVEIPIHSNTPTQPQGQPIRTEQTTASTGTGGLSYPRRLRPKPKPK